MNYYETLYIVHPALESGRLKDIILSIQDIFKNLDLNIIGTDVWGKKKLAYLIDKQKYGTYVLVQFEGDGQLNGKLSVELEHNPNILSYLSSKITEENLKKDLPSLDEQIHGTRLSDSKTNQSSNKVIDKSKEDSDQVVEESKESKEASDETEKKLINENSEENHGTNE